MADRPENYLVVYHAREGPVAVQSRAEPALVPRWHPARNYADANQIPARLLPRRLL